MKQLSAEYPRIKKAAHAIPKGAKEVLIHIGCFAASFFLAQNMVFYEYSPFAIGFVAAIKQKYIFASAFGGILGSLAAKNALMPFRYIAAIVAATVISYSTVLLRVKIRSTVISTANAFTTCFLTGVAMTLAQGFELAQVGICFAEGLVCGGFAYFLKRSQNSARKGVRLRALPLNDLASIAITGAVFFMCFAGFEIAGISIGRMVAVFVILIAARYGGINAGVMVGTILGVAVGLSGNVVYLAAAYAFGGLLAGLFSPIGQLGSGLAFALGTALLVLGSGDSIASLQFAEAFGAAAVFIIMPRRIGNQLDEYFNSKINVSPTGSLRQSLVVKLRFAANAMVGVSQSVESASHKLREITQKGDSTCAQAAIEHNCTRCNIKNVCWQKEKSSTLALINSLNQKIKENGVLNESNIHPDFQAKCIHIDSFLYDYNSAYREECRQELCDGKIAQVREIVAEQFYGISDMLSDLSQEFENAETFDTETAEKVRRIMNEYGVYPNDVSCVTDKFARLRVQAHCPCDSNFKSKAMHSAVAKACDRYFETPSITFAGSDALISYCEKAVFSLEIGTCQRAYNGAALCGDCIEIINDGKGRQIIIISDGMGNGGRAAVDGAMASGLLARLIKAGFGFDCSLRVVNAALLVKSNEESLATLDIVCVDLFTGKTDFYKAGAAASMVLKDGTAHELTLSSLPAGILREVEFAKTSTFLENGDQILLFSDGMSSDNNAWLKEAFENSAKAPPHELSETLLQLAKKRQGLARGDDMTVIVAKLNEN